MSDPLLDTALVVLTLSKLTMSTALLWLAMRLRRLTRRARVCSDRRTGAKGRSTLTIEANRAEMETIYNRLADSDPRCDECLSPTRHHWSFYLIDEARRANNAALPK